MAELRIDDLQLKGLKIVQDPDLFCFGTDAVHLSNFVRLKPRSVHVDFCSGNGIIPLLLHGHVPTATIYGIEILEKNITLANQSLALNGINDQIQMICGDVKNAKSLLPREVDSVSCNPPYDTSGLTSACYERSVARHEILITLEDVVRSAAEVLRTGGTFFIIHRAQRLCELTQLMQTYELEPKRLQPIYPSREKPSSYVLVEGKKQAASGVILLPGIYSKND